MFHLGLAGINNAFRKIETEHYGSSQGRRSRGPPLMDIAPVEYVLIQFQSDLAGERSHFCLRQRTKTKHVSFKDNVAAMTYMIATYLAHMRHLHDHKKERFTMKGIPSL